METRNQKLRQLLVETRLDGLLVTDKASKYYLSSFRGTDVALLYTLKDRFIIADRRYLVDINQRVKGFIVIDNQGQMIQALIDLVTEQQLLRLGIEGEHLTTSSYLSLKKALKPACEIVSTTELIASLRMIKDETEIKLMKKAAKLTDLAYEHCLSVVKEGMTEKDLALEIELFIKKNGGDDCAFETIVASGLRSALPHGHATAKIIKRNELITVDFGVVYQHYYSDMTRTFALGEVHEKLKEIYQVVKEAGELALAKIEIGITTGEVDQICRSFIERAGYGDYFNHGTGHGLGLSCHEYPYLKADVTEKLQAGMTFTLEPGIYLPSFGGVRLEDDIYLNSQGKAEILTKSTREWMEL